MSHKILDLTAGSDLNADWIRLEHPSQKLVEMLRRQRLLTEKQLEDLQKKVVPSDANN